jgi:purine nucleoside phosphorylase
MTHTPEPWRVDSISRSCVTNDEQGKYVPVSGPGWSALAEFACDTDGGEAGVLRGRINAARAVACVNACAGINPEAVPDMLMSVKTFLDMIDHSDLDDLDFGRGLRMSGIIDAMREDAAKATGQQ